MTSNREIARHFRATVQEYTDGGITLLFDEIKGRDLLRLHEIGEGTLHDAFQTLAQDILDGNVFPEDYPVNLIDGMIVKRGSSHYVRHFNGTESSWLWTDGLGAHPDSQIVAWLVDGSADIKYDPANED